MAGRPHPLYDVDPQALHTYTLQRHGTPLTITAKGVYWNKGWYIDGWMHGHGGEKVELRYMPHHYGTVELYDPVTGRYRGDAFLAGQATPKQAREVRRAWQRKADRLRAQLKKANKNRVARYAATSRATAPEATDVMTQEEATRQLNDLHTPQPEPEPAPAFLPLPEPTEAWGGTAAAHRPQETQNLGRDDGCAPEWYALPEPTSTGQRSGISRRIREHRIRQHPGEVREHDSRPPVEHPQPTGPLSRR